VGEYADFLDSKFRPAAAQNGIEPGPVHSSLYPFQVAIVDWAVRLGRAAVFADCGLGKTRIQIEWARQVAQFTSKPVLILAPIAVSVQTRDEGNDIGCRVNICRSQEEVLGGVNITNYEMLHAFDPSGFSGVVLDESSILKSFMGKTKRRLMEAFHDTKYKLCCTATPAPNDYMELGNHSQFLNVLASNEMLARWFINNSMEAGDYRLKRHAESDFWRWVNSWAVSLEKPSDIGFDDGAFVLPELRWHQETVRCDNIDPRKSGVLFHDPMLSATTLHREMRRTAFSRAAKAAELVQSKPDESWLLWCNTNYEADEIRKAIPNAVEVRGSDKTSHKENALNGFSSGDIQILLTKPKIAGFGMNWQHCNNVIFVGLSYSYESLYQSIRRVWRFGQRKVVDGYIVTADTETRVLETVRAKERAHNEMKRSMNGSMKRIELGNDNYELKESEGSVERGNGWEIHLGDSAVVMEEVESDSVGLSVFSPPFSNLYIYSDYREDLGNSRNHEEFFKHFEFIARQLFRITKPGRICAVHCKDLPLYKGRDGAAGLMDFPGRVVQMFSEVGWTYHSRVTIWKCPVTEMTRTKNHGLLYKQLRKDSSASRMGMADYVIAFRKWGDGVDEFQDPVTHSRDEFPLDRWRNWASPVWMDINQTRVLSYREARGNDDEKHICPLQLEVIERCVQLWSNPGDLVMSPLAGIGSEGYESVRLGRRFIGIELKPEYYNVAIKNIRHAEQQAGTSLLDLMEATA